MSLAAFFRQIKTLQIATRNLIENMPRRCLEDARRLSTPVVIIEVIAS